MLEVFNSVALYAALAIERSTGDSAGLGRQLRASLSEGPIGRYIPEHGVDALVAAGLPSRAADARARYHDVNPQAAKGSGRQSGVHWGHMRTAGRTRASW